jgi:glycerophosphoryl diester phosphodiesterase
MKIRLIVLVGLIAVLTDGLGQKLPKISAHRGASKDAPENTLAAFAKAIELGADYLEVDVRTTSDGIQICMHDRSLKRTTGIDADVRATPFETIRQASAGQWFGEAYAQEKVPTFEALCELVNRSNHDFGKNAKLYVDCKDIDAGEVVRILNKNQILDSAVFYGDVSVLKELSKFHPAARFMPAYPGAKKAKRLVHTLPVYAFDMNWDEIDTDAIKQCHEFKVKVFSDLLDENDTPAAYQRAILLGIDLIQTDKVKAVRQAFIDFEHQK